MFTENRTLKKCCKWNIVNILCFEILFHNPDILDISMVK